MLGSFTFILHTHLPYVLHHGKWPHGSDWLSEAVAECYLPLLSVLESLDQEGLRPRISMDFSPILLEQLADPAFPDVFAAYCKEKITAAEQDFDFFATNKEEYLRPLAEYWREFYTNAQERFMALDGNLPATFRGLSERGMLDAMTCGASHGYFPLLGSDANVRAQIRGAMEVHEEHFGKKPRGIWLPECGYRPRYFWSPPVGPEAYRQRVTERAGIEELLAEAGIEYFIVDGALTKGGLAVAPYQPFAQELHDRYLAATPTSGSAGNRGGEGSPFNPGRSLADVYWVKSTSRELPGPAPAVFSRDPRSAARVWAADMGYPGAGVYLDFHKKHHNSGLRYWRVTGPQIDLGRKEIYVPEQSEWQLDYDANDFVELVQRSLLEHASQHDYFGVIAAPFDTELFGHWWFEGPRFLEKVMRRMRLSPEIQLTDCAEALDAYTAPRQMIALPEGSWGEGGHHFVWTNQAVAWMWDAIYPLEDRFLRVLHTLMAPSQEWNDGDETADQQEVAFQMNTTSETPWNGPSPLEESDTLLTIMHQAARELLLLEASDWQFVISTKGAVEYSKQRFMEHGEFLSRLLDMAEHYNADEGLTDEDASLLQEALVKDRPFPNIDLRWWTDSYSPRPAAPSLNASSQGAVSGAA